MSLLNMIFIESNLHRNYDTHTNQQDKKSAGKLCIWTMCKVQAWYTLTYTKTLVLNI